MKVVNKKRRAKEERNFRKHMEKNGWDFSKTLNVSVSSEYSFDAAEMVDGYQSHNDVQNKIASKETVDNLFDDLVKENILNFKKKRTTERKVVENVVLGWIEENLDIAKVYEQKCFVLNNSDKMANFIQQTAQKYKEYKDKENKENPGTEPVIWKLGEKKYDKEKYEKVDYKKYALKECWLRKNRSSIEKGFEKFLDESSDVEYWYKNGDNGKDHFGISYADDDDKIKIFYPDYVVKSISNGIYIFDTKSGIIYKTAKLKAEALYDYCKENNVNGGIVKIVGSVWKFNEGKDFDPNKDDQLKPISDLLKKGNENE